MEDTVAKELQTLHNLRKLFVQDLQARIKKVCVNLKKNILYLKRDAVGTWGVPNSTVKVFVWLILLASENCNSWPVRPQVCYYSMKSMVVNKVYVRGTNYDS